MASGVLKKEMDERGFGEKERAFIAEVWPSRAAYHMGHGTWCLDVLDVQYEVVSVQSSFATFVEAEKALACRLVEWVDTHRHAGWALPRIPGRDFSYTQ